MAPILLEPNVLDISSKLIQLWLQEIFQQFNVMSRCNGYCTAVLFLKKERPQNTKFCYSTPNRNSLTVKRSLVKFMGISSCPILKILLINVHRCGPSGSMQQAQVRSLVRTSFLGKVFLTCKTNVGKVSAPKVPEYHLGIIIINHHSLWVPMTWDVDVP